MGDQNRKTFKYRIRRGGHNQADPRRIQRLGDLQSNHVGAAIGRVDLEMFASVADIEKYRRAMGRL